MSDAIVPVSSAQIKELASRNKQESYKSGYMVTSYEAIPALPELQDQLGVGLIARRCKQARLQSCRVKLLKQSIGMKPVYRSTNLRLQTTGSAISSLLILLFKTLQNLEG